MRNDEFPFFDTSVSNKVNFVNSVSLLNIQSINDFQNKIDKKIEIDRFRGNIYVDGIKHSFESELLIPDPVSYTHLTLPTKA